MRLQVSIHVWVALICMFYAGFSAAAAELSLSGDTMGTTYHIKVVTEAAFDVRNLKSRIDQRLEALNQSMSTYRFDSEISRFNRLQSVDTSFEISTDFLSVMLAADAIYRLTDGAWDGTVNPLINLWGFGPSGRIDKLPSAQAIGDALKNVGFDQIEVSAKGFLRKHRAEVTIDLASIAKGYGVDQIAQLIEASGLRNYLVEIGGEVYAAGRHADKKRWRVGINLPRKTAAADAVYIALELEDQAMATSGDYRNFEVIDGHAYSHIIDPHSGYPIDNGVVSTSVVAPNCTLADGLATALMVMSPDKGIHLLNSVEEVEGVVIVRKPDGSLENHWSSGMSGRQ